MATRRSAGRVIAELAREAPDGLSVTCGNAAVTRLGLEQESNRMARVYQELGVHEGDFITIGLPNSIELVVAIVATWKLGAGPMPVVLPAPIAGAAFGDRPGQSGACHRAVRRRPP